jgi:ankyrin repeat protein
MSHGLSSHPDSGLIWLMKDHSVNIGALSRLTIYLVVCLILISSSIIASGQSLEELFNAAQNNDPQALTSLLDRGLDPNSTNREGDTLLMVAAMRGYSDLVQILLAHKAAVDRRNPYGDTALMMASLKGHLEVVKLLIEHGAKVNPEGWTPLGYAAYGGDAAVVRYLLSKGADVDAVQPNGDTALMLAARKDRVEAARELLYADADFDYRGPGGETALGLAEHGADEALVELLRQAGAAR